MIALSPLPNLARLAAQAFISGLWQSLALTLAVALALRLVPRLSASIRFALWTATFTLAAAVPFLHLPTRSLPTVDDRTIHLQVVWAAAIAAAWFLASAIRIVQLARQAVHLRRIWSNATPIQPAPSIAALLRDSARNPVLCASADIDAPSVIGFLAPRLLVPDWLLPALTEPELRQIVLHECEHLRRRDDWLNLAQKLALALFPLNPALLFADRRLSLERELACDAGVIAATRAPFDYAACLTRLAEQRLHRRGTLALALSAWSHQTRHSELARRVHRLLSPIRTMSPLHLRASLALLTLALAAGTTQLARTPALISFSSPAAAPISEALTPPTVLPAVYHQPEAVQPLPTRRPRLLNVSHHAGAHTQRPMLRPAAAANPSGSRTVLTLSHTTGIPVPRTMPVVWTNLSPTYAAVPFANGWLIIQL